MRTIAKQFPAFPFLAFALVGAAAATKSQTVAVQPGLLECAVANGRADTAIALTKSVLASTEPGDSSFKAQLGLTGVDSSAVVVVTDTVVCTRVTRVVDSATQARTPATTAYFVYRAGPIYFVYTHLDPRPALFLVDTTYRFLGWYR
jgi:hypothetical protein